MFRACLPFGGSENKDPRFPGLLNVNGLKMARDSIFWKVLSSRLYLTGLASTLNHSICLTRNAMD